MAAQLKSGPNPRLLLKPNAKPFALYTPRNVQIHLRKKVQDQLSRMQSLIICHVISCLIISCHPHLFNHQTLCKPLPLKRQQSSAETFGKEMKYLATDFQENY